RRVCATVYCAIAARRKKRAYRGNNEASNGNVSPPGNPDKQAASGERREIRAVLPLYINVDREQSRSVGVQSPTKVRWVTHTLGVGTSFWTDMQRTVAVCIRNRLRAYHEDSHRHY
ncbi:unnamed protein product, partial [Ectocarpus sp. 12 AP-2014]